jgi:hypothetical protein
LEVINNESLEANHTIKLTEDLVVTYGADLKVLLIKENMVQGNTVKEEVSFQILEFSLELNKS